MNVRRKSTIKTVVAKLKEAGQPYHKIIQVTGHPRELFLVDYDETTQNERKQLSYTASGYSASASTAPVQRSIQAVISSTLPRPAEALNTKETSPANPYELCDMLPFFTPSHSITMTARDLQQQPFQVFNQCVFSTKDNMSLARLLTRPKTEEKTCHHRLGLELTDCYKRFLNS